MVEPGLALKSFESLFHLLSHCIAASPKNIPKEKNVIKGEILSWKSPYVNSFQFHYFSTCLQYHHCLSNPNPFSPFLNKDEFVIKIKSICVKNYVCIRDVFLCIKERLTLFLTEI